MKWSTCFWSQGICTAILGVTLGTPGARSDPLLPFDLPRWKTGERVRLEDFAGQILVLDFFAWWCAPCVQTSSELETGVQQFYSTRQVNSHGVPVRVVSVNIEKDFPRRTTEFLRRTGASFVVDDTSTLLFKQYGNPGIPFLAVIDGTGTNASITIRDTNAMDNAGRFYRVRRL